MSSDDFDAVRPVQGQEIRVSLATRVGITLFALVLLVAAGSVTAWTWKAGEPSYEGLLLVLAGLIALAAGVTSLFMEFVLILGTDRLQNVRNGRVMGQVPYRNIERVEICEKDGAASLRVTLVDREDPDTFWERRRAEWYDVSVRTWGCDVFITPDSSVPIRAVLDTIQAGRQRAMPPPEGR